MSRLHSVISVGSRGLRPSHRGLRPGRARGTCHAFPALTGVLRVSSFGAETKLYWFLTGTFVSLFLYCRALFQAQGSESSTVSLFLSAYPAEPSGEGSDFHPMSLSFQEGHFIPHVGCFARLQPGEEPSPDTQEGLCVASTVSQTETPAVWAAA